MMKPCVKVKYYVDIYCEIACVMDNNRSSSMSEVCNCIPIGNPCAEYPAGKLIEGIPAILDETVK